MFEIICAKIHIKQKTVREDNKRRFKNNIPNHFFINVSMFFYKFFINNISLIQESLKTPSHAFHQTAITPECELKLGR